MSSRSRRRQREQQEQAPKLSEEAIKWQKDNKEAIESMRRFHEKHGSFSEECGRL